MSIYLPPPSVLLYCPFPPTSTPRTKQKHITREVYVSQIKPRNIHEAQSAGRSGLVIMEDRMQATCGEACGS